MHNKTKNSPEDPIFISVPAGSRQIYTSNDVIYGSLLIHPTVRPQAVVISLQGRIKQSNGHNSNKGRQTPDFFLYSLKLFQSFSQGQSYDILQLGVNNDGRVELPFEFLWPNQTELEVNPLWTKLEGFEHQNGGPLPSSYRYHFGDGENVIEQAVEYFLEAWVYTTTLDRPEIKVSYSLAYRPPFKADIADAAPCIKTDWSKEGSRLMTLRSHRLYPDYDPSDTLGHKLKDRWTKLREAVPAVWFQIEGSFPCILTSCKPVEFTLSLSHLRYSKELAQMPYIYLRRILVRLRSTLNVRIPLDSSGFRSKEVLQHYHESTKLLHRTFDEGNGMLIYDGVPLRTQRLSAQLAPNFKTYLLALEHMLEMKIWGECAKEKFELMPVVGKVWVVWTKSEDEQEAEGLETPVATEDAAPPPYWV